MTDITPIIDAVIKLILAIATAFLIPYIKKKTTATQRAELEAWVNIAVTAAEQIYKGSGRGKEKKEYVLKWLNEHNIDYDEEKIDACIEKAVYNLNHAFLAEAIEYTGELDTTK